MQTTALFRTILIVSLITSLIGTVIGIIPTDIITQILREYFFVVTEEMSDYTAVIEVVILITALIFFIISTIGLWKFKNWARVMYVVAIITTLLLYLMVGIIIMTPWKTIINDIALILNGVLLTMIFSSPINKEFRSKG